MVSRTSIWVVIAVAALGAGYGLAVVVHPEPAPTREIGPPYERTIRVGERVNETVEWKFAAQRLPLLSGPFVRLPIDVRGEGPPGHGNLKGPRIEVTIFAAGESVFQGSYTEGTNVGRTKLHLPYVPEDTEHLWPRGEFEITVRARTIHVPQAGTSHWDVIVGPVLVD